MKKLYIVVLFLFSVLFGVGCQEVTAPPENRQEISGGLLLKVSDESGNTFSVVNGTISVPTNTNIVFVASSSNAAIVNFQWEFQDSYITLSGKTVMYKYALYPPATTTLKLTGINAQNQSIDTTITVKVIWPIMSADNIFKVLSVTALPANLNFAEVVFAGTKERTPVFGPLSVIGQFPTSANWSTSVLPVADTGAYLNGSIIVNSGSEPGTHCIVRIIINKGSHMIGIARGNQWIDFTGSPFADPSNPTHLVFTLSEDYQIIPGGDTTVVTGLPGTLGDTGASWALRMTPGESTIDLFFHLSADFTSGAPFVALKDSNSSVVIKKNLEATDDPRVGKITLSYSQLPTYSNINVIPVILSYGPKISQPNTPDVLMVKSSSYNLFHKDLRFLIQKVGLGKSVSIWKIDPIMAKN